MKFFKVKDGLSNYTITAEDAEIDDKILTFTIERKCIAAFVEWSHFYEINDFEINNNNLL
jgi:hypothetical protein